MVAEPASGEENIKPRSFFGGTSYKVEIVVGLLKKKNQKKTGGLKKKEKLKERLGRREDV